MKTLMNVQNQIIEVEDIVYEDAKKWHLSGHKRMLADPEPSNGSMLKKPVQEFILAEQNYNQ